MSLIMRLIVGLIVFLYHLKTQATPLPLLTRTATVRTNPGGRPRISLGRGGGALVLGLDARRARRQVRKAMPHCAGPGRTTTLYQPNISVIYQRPTDNALSALYQD